MAAAAVSGHRSGGVSVEGGSGGGVREGSRRSVHSRQPTSRRCFQARVIAEWTDEVGDVVSWVSLLAEEELGSDT